MKKSIETCYLCKSKSIKFAFRKLSHDFWLCHNCGLYALNFGYDYDKFIKDYYQKGYFTGDKKLIAYADYEGDKPIVSRNMRNYIERISRYLRSAGLENSKKPLKMLDCGCAMGFFMEQAQRLGYDAYGIDVSKYAVEKGKEQFGDKIKAGPVEKTGQLFKNRKFDVITMFDLIEHLKDPITVLKSLRNSLNKNGVIVLQTGDTSSRWSRHQGKNWHFFAPPQHLHFFNRKTIKDLLDKSGYELTTIEIDGKWVSLRYLFHMMRYINHDRIANFMYDHTRNNFIGKIPILFKFGDNMIVFAKKKD